MRNTATDKVAHVDVASVRNLQICVLVVDPADALIRGEWHAHAVTHAREPHRQIDVERRVALAERKDREAGFRL